MVEVVLVRKVIVKEYAVWAMAGFIWLRIWTTVGHLSTTLTGSMQ
jgi:hypothetical protein